MFLNITSEFYFVLLVLLILPVNIISTTDKLMFTCFLLYINENIDDSKEQM